LTRASPYSLREAVRQFIRAEVLFFAIFLIRKVNSTDFVLKEKGSHNLIP
jgi:hypothetical protein